MSKITNLKTSTIGTTDGELFLAPYTTTSNIIGLKDYIKEHGSSGISIYDNTKTYNIDEVVINNDKIYKSKIDNNTEFNEDNWILLSGITEAEVDVKLSNLELPDSDKDNGITVVDLTGQVQTKDYIHSVIALCKVSLGAYEGNDSFSNGVISLHRINGNNNPSTITVALNDYYLNEASVRGEIETKLHSSISKAKLCTFVKNGILYGGVDIHIADPASDIVKFIGASNFDIFGVDYISNTGEIFDEEISESISYTNVLLNDNWAYNYNTVLTSASDVLTSKSDVLTSKSDVLTSKSTLNASTVYCTSLSTNASYPIPFVYSANTTTAGFNPLGIDNALSLYYNPSTNTLTTVNINSTSDYRLKENIVPIEEDLIDKIDKINLVKYKYKDEFIQDSIDYYGVIAQEFGEIFPEFITITKTERFDDEHTINEPKIIYITLKGVQELNKKIKVLENENKELNKKIDEIYNILKGN